jgi:tetratricopeptide (TPR) repeat protein
MRLKPVFPSPRRDKSRAGCPAIGICTVLIVAWALCVIPVLAQNPTGPAALTSAQQAELDDLAKQGDQAVTAKDYPSAEKAYQAGLDRATALGSDRDSLVFLNGLYSVDTLVIVYDKGMIAARQALAIADRIHDQSARCNALIQIGTLQRETEQFDTSLDTLAQAFALAKTLKSLPMMAQSLYELGMVRMFRGQLADSEDYFARARTAYTALGNGQQIASCTYNLAFAYVNDGSYEKADSLLNEALATSQLIGYLDGVAKCDIGLGMLNFLEGKYAAGLKNFKAAAGVNTAFPSPANESWTLMGLSLCESSLPEMAPQSVIDGQAALNIFQSLNNQTFLVVGYLTVGTAQAAAGDLTAAHDAYQHATDDYEQLSRAVTDPRELGGLQQLARHLYQRSAAVLVRMGRPGDALVEVESGRGQGLARQAKISGVDFADRLNPADAAALKTSQAALTRASSLLRAESGDGVSGKQDQSDPLLLQYQDAEHTNDLLLHRLYDSNPDYKRLQSFSPPTQEQLKALADHNPDTLYVEWAVVDDRTTLAFTLSQKDGIQAFSLPLGEHALTNMTLLWRSQIGAPEGEGRGGPTKPDARRATEFVNVAPPVNEAHALYTVLLGPLAKAGLLAPGRYARLVFIADGPLLDVPLPALAEGPDKLLIDRYAVSNSISLGILTWAANDRQPTATLLCAADPMGVSGEVSVVAKQAGFSPLSGARNEARTISLLFHDPLVMIGPDAREGRVKAEMGKYDILHFATHAVPDSENGLRSHLILAPEPPDSPEDGELEAREIIGIPLTARLTVLSACETGQGQQTGGEGLLGLVWAFRAAGCPSVVASLWQVNDQATAKLMEAFYKNLQSGARKDDALRSAIQTVRQTFPNTLDWAAFQVIGDTSAVPPIGPSKAPH